MLIGLLTIIIFHPVTGITKVFSANPHMAGVLAILLSFAMTMIVSNAVPSKDEKQREIEEVLKKMHNIA
ncbi:MAG: hypothetical protein AB1341_15340 [Bacillota bacterium]